MKCPHCNRTLPVETKLKPITMSRKQFEKLKKGSVVVSTGKRQRTVVDKIGNYIKFRKLSYGGGYPHDYTGYLYSDISRGWKVVKF